MIDSPNVLTTVYRGEICRCGIDDRDAVQLRDVSSFPNNEEPALLVCALDGGTDETDSGQTEAIVGLDAAEDLFRGLLGFLMEHGRTVKLGGV